MAFVEYFKRLYSLDTLDTRFTDTSRTQSRQTKGDVQGQIDPAKAIAKNVDSNAVPSPRWESTEFYIYYVFFILVVPMMFKVSYDVSKRKHRILCDSKGIAEPDSTT